MQRLILLVSALICWTCGASLARAQAVQLPTFRYFSVNTTVSVPDRGGVVLGGVNRARSGTTTRGFGPLRNRASGHEVGSSIASVHATIIDHEELDREVLAEAARRREARGEGALVLRAGPSNSKADYLSRHVAKRDETLTRSVSEAPSPSDSLAAIREQAARRQSQREAEAAEKLAAGKESEAAGKFASARGYYEAAARLNVPDVSQEAATRLARIKLPGKKVERVAKD